MQLWILYSDYYDQNVDNSAYRMLNEAKSLNIDSELYFFNYFKLVDNVLFYKEEKVTNYPEIVFMRGHLVWLIKHFEQMGVKCVNSSFTMENCRDKWLTHQIVSQTSAIQPKTFLLENLSYNECINKVSLPFIIKYRHGAQGNNIYLINNEEDFNNLELEFDRIDYMIQEYINTSYGKDLRVYIIGNKALGACMRVNEESFTSNLAQGGKSYHYELDSNLESLCLDISSKLKGDIISVDFLFGKDRLYFCEANTNAGFASFNYLGYKTRYEMLTYIKTLIRGDKDEN